MIFVHMLERNLIIPLHNTKWNHILYPEHLLLVYQTKYSNIYFVRSSKGILYRSLLTLYDYCDITTCIEILKSCRFVVLFYKSHILNVPNEKIQLVLAEEIIRQLNRISILTHLSQKFKFLTEAAGTFHIKCGGATSFF